MSLSLDFTDATFERLVQRVAQHLATDPENGASSPWMRTDEAAEYLRCSVSRVRKLAMTGDLPHEKDGSRNLYHRDELDEYVRKGGASAP